MRSEYTDAAIKRLRDHLGDDMEGQHLLSDLLRHVTYDNAHWPRDVMALQHRVLELLSPRGFKLPNGTHVYWFQGQLHYKLPTQ